MAANAETRESGCSREGCIMSWREALTERERMDEGKLTAARRTREVVRVTKLFCQMVVRKFGHTGANAVRFLGVRAALVNRYATSGEFLEW